MNPGTIVVLVIVAVILGSVVFSMARNKKQGKSSCGCGCKSCPNSALCKSGKSRKA